MFDLIVFCFIACAVVEGLLILRRIFKIVSR